jgi:hypothetical protein
MNEAPRLAATGCLSAMRRCSHSAAGSAVPPSSISSPSASSGSSGSAGASGFVSMFTPSLLSAISMACDDERRAT